MHPHLNLFKRIGTDRLNLYTIYRFQSWMEVEADACGGIWDVWPLPSHCLISTSASSCNAAHLNEPSSPVKRRKTEETLKLHWKDSGRYEAICTCLLADPTDKLVKVLIVDACVTRLEC